MSEIRAYGGGMWTASINGGDWTDLGWAEADGLTFTPVPEPTVTVEVVSTDWWSEFWVAMLGGRVVTGGVVEGDMVRFDRPDGVTYVRRDVLGLEEP